MYAIYSDGRPLWAPTLHQQGYDITGPTLEMELNAFGSLTFTLEPKHPMYDQITRLKSVITVERDGKQIWRGRLLETETDFYRQKKCTCEGELAFLVDYIQPPFAYTGTLKGYLEYVLNQYNANVDEFKRFYLGNVTVVDTNDYVYRYKDTYNTTWAVLSDQLLNSYGGYLVPRTEDGAHYLDYLAELPESGQLIQFGQNLLDLEEITDASAVYTVLVPLGAMPEGGNTEGDRLTIKAVNAGKAYIENAAGVSLYGRIWATKTYEDITTAKALLSTAKTDLAAGVLAASTINVSAVDLTLAGVETDALECGTMVHVISRPHGIDTWLPLSKASIPLQEPGKESYTLGKSMATLTDAALKAAKQSGNTTVIVKQTAASATAAETEGKTNGNDTQ